jgi:hypothetical protein
VKEIVIGKCWDYFNENFHKFSEANKIKIGLALCTKDIPTQFDGSCTPETKIIIVRSDGNKTETLAGQVCVQPEEIPRPVVKLGDGQDSRIDIAGNVIQRGNS